MATDAGRDTAAAVLQEAIAHAGLTVSAAAATARVSRPLLQEYLAGRKQPSYAQLVRIVSALGGRLRWVADRPRPSAALAARRAELLELLADHGVVGALLFGSVARGTDTEHSDLDIAVQFRAGLQGNVEAVAAAASALLGVRADVLDADWMSPELLDSIVAGGRPL